MEIPPTQLHWVASSTRSQPHRKRFVTSTPKKWGNLFGYTTLKRIFMGRSGKDRLRLNMISEIGLPTISRERTQTGVLHRKSNSLR